MSATVIQLRSNPTEGDFIPLVSNGSHSLVYVRHETRLFFRQPKVVFWFRVIDEGPDFGKVIPRYYNVRKFKGKPGSAGRFVPGRSSSYVREYARMFPDRIDRLDRIPIDPFKQAVILGNVKTVTKDRAQEKLPEVLHYSVIEKLVRIER